MSAFICQPKTFARIYQGLRAFERMEDSRYEKYPNAASEIQDFTFPFDGAEDVVHQLYLLNVKAVDQKYGEQVRKKLADYTWEDISLETEVPSVGQFLKSMECLLYQMSEGSVPNENLYQFLSQIIGHVKDDMVHHMAEYEEAEPD